MPREIQTRTADPSSPTSGTHDNVSLSSKNSLHPTAFMKQNSITSFFSPKSVSSTTNSTSPPVSSILSTTATSHSDAPCLFTSDTDVRNSRSKRPVGNESLQPAINYRNDWLPVRSLRTTLPIIMSPKITRTSDMNRIGPAIKPSVLFADGDKALDLEMPSLNSKPVRSTSSQSDVYMGNYDESHKSDDGKPAEDSVPKNNQLVCHIDDDDPFASSPTQSPFVSPKPHKTFTNDMTIRASDDEESNCSDDSFTFAPLSTIGKPFVTLIPAPKSPMESPKMSLRSSTFGKRPAPKSYLSAKSSKKAKIDWDDLIADAKKDQVVGQRIKEATAQYEKSAEALTSPARPTMTSSLNSESRLDLKKSLKAVIEDKEDAPQIDKIVRAVERTDASKDRDHVWRFFSDQNDQTMVEAPPFPTRQMERHIIGLHKAGLPRSSSERRFQFDYLLMSLSSNHKATSPEILEWLVKSGCVTESPAVHKKTLRCLRYFQDFNHEFTPKLLRDCMELLGAKKEVFDFKSQMEIAIESQDHLYLHRSWTRLTFMLAAFNMLVPYMAKQFRMTVIIMLLKMTADVELMVSTDVQTVYFEIMSNLLMHTPSRDIGSVAMEASRALFNNFKSRTLLWSILKSIPLTHLTAADMRRRLAISFLLNDPKAASKNPDTLFGLRDATQYLEKPIFQVNIGTDYRLVRSSIGIIDIAIDNGGAPPQPDTPSYDQLQGKELLQVFNEDVDALAETLKYISRAINDVNMGSMLPAETKGQIDILSNRLEHTVRYGGAMKLSIYGPTAYVRDDRPKKWTTLVKTGQAKEKGQQSIFSFAKKKNTPKPEAKAPKPLSNQSKYLVPQEDMAVGLIEPPLTPSLSGRTWRTETPQTDWRTRSMSTAIRNSPPTAILDTPPTHRALENPGETSGKESGSTVGL